MVIQFLENWAILLKETTEKALNQKWRFLGDIFGPLTKVGLPLVKNILTPLAKTVLILLVLATTASATNATIPKKIYGTGMTTMIISNEEIKGIMKIVVCYYYVTYRFYIEFTLYGCLNVKELLP